MTTLKIRVPAGIGDFSWIWSKLSTLNYDYEVYVSKDGINRADTFLKLLPRIVKVEYCSQNFHEISDHCIPWNTDVNKFIEKAQKEIVNFSLNRWLEQGNRIEKFMDQIQTDFNYKINLDIDESKIPFKTVKELTKPVAIYMSNYNCVNNWLGWTPKSWSKFMKLLAEKYKDVSFILVGAQYDRQFSDDVKKLVLDLKVYNFTGILYLNETLQMIKYCKCLIGFPSGIPILATVLNIPTLMFYPEHLQRLALSWINPKLICENKYIPKLFKEPDEIVKIIGGTTWLQ